MPSTSRSSNFIPLPTRPVRSIPKPLAKTLYGPKKTTSSQTERLVLIKEETLTLHPCCNIGLNDGGMRRDYIKAVNYINSVHKFINSVAEKNALDKSTLFTLPQIANFAPLFHILLGRKGHSKGMSGCGTKRKSSISSSCSFQKSEQGKTSSPRSQNEKTSAKNIKPDLGQCPESRRRNPEKNDHKNERKPKSGNVVQKIARNEENRSPISVGDFPAEEPKKGLDSPELIKEQLSLFLTTLQGDLQRAAANERQKKCKNLTMMKNKLQKLTNFFEIPMETPESLKTPPEPPILDIEDTLQSEPSSLIMSDVFEDLKNSQSTKRSKFLAESSESTLLSENSDIQSDSDVDIDSNFKILK